MQTTEQNGLSITCISDMHGHLPNIKPTDILLIAGDITPATDHTRSFQINWLDTIFRRWLENVPAKHIVGVAGNHDFCFQEDPKLVPADLKWTYLNCSSTSIDGLNIYGSPWSNWFYNWSFNAPREGGEEFLANLYKDIPEGTNIVVTHGPPFGGNPALSHKADLTQPYRGNPPQYVGSKSLLERVKQVRPQLIVTGHIHEGYGTYPLSLSIDGNAHSQCLVVNASVVNERYKLVNDPIVFDGTVTSDSVLKLELHE